MGIIETIKMLERDEGLHEGLKIGRKEGHKEGHKEGRKEGREEVKSAFVKKLLMAGKFSVEEVANFADVTESFVRKIKRTL